jgi:DNA-binding transcriptional ArsR family regulator
LTPAARGEAAGCLRTLGHPARLHLLECLEASPCTVGELAEACGLSQPATSTHLRLLERCGFLASTRAGAFVRYRLASPALRDLLNLLRRRFSPPPPTTSGTPHALARLSPDFPD